MPISPAVKKYHERTKMARFCHVSVLMMLFLLWLFKTMGVLGSIWAQGLGAGLVVAYMGQMAMIVVSHRLQLAGHPLLPLVAGVVVKWLLVIIGMVIAFKHTKAGAAVLVGFVLGLAFLYYGCVRLLSKSADKSIS